VGLSDLGRHAGYVARQLKRWTAQWEATRDAALPAMDEAARLLGTRLPAQQGTAIVHGDYRLGNMLVARGRIAAVLDWELCTLGDALADVGYIMNHWPTPDEVTPTPSERLPTHAGGFPSRSEFIAHYARHSTRDLQHIDYYRALAHWRTAAIRQGVYKRYAEGAMAGRPRLDLENLRTSVARCAEAALALLT
jgi:aminoglycoside phosphotransferase (APT) family kinase protein